MQSTSSTNKCSSSLFPSAHRGQKKRSFCWLDGFSALLFSTAQPPPRVPLLIPSSSWSKSVINIHSLHIYALTSSTTFTVPKPPLFIPSSLKKYSKCPHIIIRRRKIFYALPDYWLARLHNIGLHLCGQYKVEHWVCDEHRSECPGRLRCFQVPIYPISKDNHWIVLCKYGNIYDFAEMTGKWMDEDGDEDGTAASVKQSAEGSRLDYWSQDFQMTPSLESSKDGRDPSI